MTCLRSNNRPVIVNKHYIATKLGFIDSGVLILCQICKLILPPNNNLFGK